MTTSLSELWEEWRQHPQGRRRAAGGLNALSGFAYQLATSLEQFIDLALDGDADAEVAFEVLSDIATAEGGLYYLVQAKTALSNSTAVDVAAEAMAVDAFLVDRHPDLRDAFTYAVQCRDWRSGDPRRITAEQLKLGPEERKRWAYVRSRMLEPVVRSAPQLRLVLKLFPQVEDPFGLVAEMTGELLRRLGAHDPPSAIADALLRMLSAGRSELQLDPPPRLVSAEDFAEVSGGTQITLGQRPTVERLAGGSFMARPIRSTGVVGFVKEALTRAVDRDALTVCWLSGGSGVGKSVLLLQALEEMAREGGPILHLLSPTDSAFEAALYYWRKREAQIVLTIDDLFAPARRDGAQWDRLADLAMHPGRTRSLVVLTAGPDTYLAAFRQVSAQTGAFEIEELAVEGLDEREQSDYRRWFEARTGVQPPALAEPLFIVAAFRSVIAGVEASSIEEFARRFMARAQAMQIDHPMYVALAMNGMGVPAPAGLFADRLGELTELIEEDVVAVHDSDCGEQAVTMFHQVVAAELYRQLVPESRTELRAQHLAAAVEACGRDAAAAAAIIIGLPARRGHEERRVVNRLLERSWGKIRLAATDIRQTAVVAAWLFTARDIGFSLDREPYRGQVLGLVGDGTPGAIVRPTVIVARVMLPEHRDALIDALGGWLETHEEDPEWPDVARQFLRLGGSPATVENWLAHHVESPGSAAVFLRLPDSSLLRVTEIERMLDQAPPIPRDWQLWREARRRGVDDDLLLAAVTRRAILAPNDRVVRRAAAFLADVAGDAHALRLAGLLHDQIKEPTLPRLLRALAFAAPAHTPLADALVRIGITLLGDFPDADHWPATWHAMYVRSGSSRDALDGVGRSWLRAHPTRAGWFVVAEAIASRDRLRGKPDWSQLFNDGSGKRDDAMCTAAADFLAEDFNAFGWSRLAVGLLEVDASPRRRDLARAWLKEVPDRSGWPFVWQALCRHRPSAEDRALGERWLAINPTASNRSLVRARLHQIRRSRG